MIREPKRDLKLKRKKHDAGWDDIKPPEGDPMIPADDMDDLIGIEDLLKKDKDISRKKRLDI